MSQHTSARRRTGAVLISLSALVATGVHPAHAADEKYVALGDSYSAGTGTRAKVDDCYRSQFGYPALVAKQHGLALDYQACSGATTSGVLSDQLETLSSSTAKVTLTIGGNDVGFTKILTECAKPGWMSDCNAAIAGGRTILTGSMPGRYDNLFGNIRGKAPNAKVVVGGYPHIFNGEDCNAVTFFSPQEEASLNSSTTDLNSLARTKATGRGFTFVDAVPSFTGHAVCDSTEWINGFSNPVEESYHPNRAGNAGYAALFGPALTGRAARTPVAVPSVQVSAAQRTRAAAQQVRGLGLSAPKNLAKAKAAGLNPAEIVRLERQLGSSDTATVTSALSRLRALDRQAG